MANDERLGGEFLTTTGMKKVIAQGGKLQRQGVPRKKKLTSLKKKVLRERLRMWKEKNGIIDNSGEVVAAGSDDVEAEKEELVVTVNYDDDDDDDDDNRPSAKRPRTEVIPGEAPLLLPSSVDKAPKSMTSSRTLLVENFVHPEEDDLLDDDEYEEIMSNLVQLASRVGRVMTTFIPRPLSHSSSSSSSSSSSDCKVDGESRHIGSAIVRFASNVETQAARDVLGGIVVGGQRLRTLILDTNEFDRLPIENDIEWRAAVLRILDDIRSSSSAANAGQNRITINPCDAQMSDIALPTEVVFHGILCDDDYEDEEALQESIEDIKALAAQYGVVVDARGSTFGNDRGNVYITYGDEYSADMAVKQFNGIVIGGSKIVVRRSNTNSSQPLEQFVPGEIVLINALNDDDLEDEDCLHESLKDIKTLAEHYGIVSSVNAVVSGDKKGYVRVLYESGHEVALHAVEKLNGVMLGGFALSVFAIPHTADGDLPNKDEPATTPPLQPLYSGNKIISATFAECKRVPKVPNAGIPRAYASKIPDERAVILLTEMLGELIRLQERSKDDKNARARRRIVMGLREVARGIRAHKVKMIVMANNLDEYGAIDTKLQEILDLARVEGLPVIYELNKRKLGKALGKSIKVSVVGIQNADGAHEQFKKLKKMLGYL
jgi:selenocysteine insertion sequence-binding protein 2